LSAQVQSLISYGTTGLIVDIECHLSQNLTNIIVGFANKAVGEAKERLRGAFANAHLELPRQRAAKAGATAGRQRIAVSIATYQDQVR
jgi:predicted ATPase with chaperone activity